MNFLFNRHKKTQVPAEFSGQQITMAITNLQGPNNKPEISLLIGILKEIDGKYVIAMNNGKVFNLPTDWLGKIKLMDPKVKSMLGNSHLLLPVTNLDMQAKGITAQAYVHDTIDIQVKK